MIATIKTGNVPDVGNLVRLRGDMWIVTHVDRRNGSDATVTATPLDDDLDTLTVVWQRERGTEIIERLELPTPKPGDFDDPEAFDAFLDAVTWGAITSADNRLLQSPFRAGIRIEDYQLVPLLRALGQSRANLLVCDDVGLGKTIEAARCVHEFVLRGRAKQCVIVCPAGLTLKWQQEMADKFGMDFVILDTKEASNIRRTFGPHVNPLNAHPYMIASIDWLKRPEQQPMIDAVLPVDEHVYPRAFDILIVDEAHNAAASPSIRYVKDTQQTALIRRIAPHFEHKF